MTVCDLCIYNPPSSCDGKPCTMCPATTNAEVQVTSIEVLDKIRAEIDDLQNTYIADGDYNEGIRFGAMQAYLIIDKYTKGDTNE